MKTIAVLSGVVSLLLLVTVVQAQSTYSSLIGVITDPSGAVVPEASVTITKQATGVARETTTNGSGEFLAPNLDPADYVVLIKKDGFSPVSRGPISLLARQVARMDVRLEIEAGAGETIDISATGVIQTDVPTIEDSK